MKTIYHLLIEYNMLFIKNQTRLNLMSQVRNFHDQIHIIIS